MRFCPQCGAPLTIAAKFCVECGSPLTGAVSGAREPGNFVGSAARGRNIPITTAFVIVFLAITVVGLGAAAWIMMRAPPRQQGRRQRTAEQQKPGDRHDRIDI